MSKTCPQCGLTCIDSAPICSQCGYVFPQEGDAPVQQPNYSQQPNVPQQTKSKKSPYKGMRGRGFAITSMVLGIIGIVMSLGGFINVMQLNADEQTMVMLVDGAFLGALALIFAIIALARKFKRQSIAGLVLAIGSLSVSASGLVTLFFGG